MRIAAVVDNEVAIGGGFNQALSAIVQMHRLSSGRFDFLVFTSSRDGAVALERLGVTVKRVRFSLLDRVVGTGSQSAPGRWMQRKVRMVGHLERRLLKDRVDLVYFVTQSTRAAHLQKLNYIATVQDLCHRDTPEFPEVREFGEFHLRESFMSRFLGPAVAVVADSPTLADALVRRYGLEADRILPMPFSPSPFLAEELSTPTDQVLARYGLDEGYLFYPAQFWAHKNHVRILQAMAILSERGHTCRAVFSGGDRGTRAHVEATIAHLGLDVVIPGFVPSEDLRGLFKGARAVVMPTYFGPTNLPPLEAWTLGRPLLYSSHLARQAGDAAQLFDPDDAEALADAILAVHDDVRAAELVEAGLAQLARVDAERRSAEAKLVEMLRVFEKKRQCWS